jgi:hypothetical protein
MITSFVKGTGKLLFAVIAMLSVTQATSQVEKLESITISLSQSSLRSTAYPFDIPFNLTGKRPDNCTRIRFCYNISKKELLHNSTYPAWISLPVRKPTGAPVLSDDWSGSDDFTLRCNGMHPGIKYDFNFEIIRDIQSDEVLKTRIKQKIIDRVSLFAKTFFDKTWGQSDIDKMNDDLTDIVNTQLLTDPNSQSLTLRNDINTKFRVNVKAMLNIETSRIVTQNAISAAAKLRFNANIPLATGQFNGIANRPFTNPLYDELQKILSGKVPLDEFSKASLDVAIAPGIDAFKGYTLRSGLLLLRKICQTPSLLGSILQGGNKISNNDIVSATETDPASIYFLDILIGYLDDKNVRTTLAAPADIMFTQLHELRQFIDALAADTRIMSDSKATMLSLLASFPDLTLNLVISQSLKSEVISIPDVTSQSTPYISLDGGIGYSSSFESAFSYYGASFYFSPVNKKAKLKTFKGINLIRKMLCINLGVASFWGDRPLHTYSILGTGNRDLFIGLGIRTGRIIKINFNCMPYKISRNPITNDRNLKLGFVAGLGVDVNLLGAFSTVAKTLNLTQ